MNSKHSIRTKIVLGFTAVIAPLVFFLIYNNYYAMSVVRGQVSVNYENLLDQYVKNIDNVLDEINYYLYQMNNDPNIGMLGGDVTDSDEHVLTTVRVLNQLNTGVAYFNKVDSFFIYNKKRDDLTLSSRGNTAERIAFIHEQLPKILELKETTSFYNWMTIKTGNSYGLVHLYQLNSDLYAGAWMNVESLENPLVSWELGQGGGVILDSPLGTVTNTAFPADKYAEMRTNMAGLSDSSHVIHVLESPYLLIKKNSRFSNISFYLAVSEAHMFQKLPYFQIAVYLIPLGGVILVGFYLLFLRRAFFKPLSELIRGMRKIGQGVFDFRLKENSSAEFAFMSTAFNDMAGHIERLKIEVYEENMKVQQAEFKHLQSQINPHFYLNSLNIIYNLAALKDYKLVQKMSLHLAGYFRFTIRHNQTSVTLQEELRHIENYLEIQQLRFPGKLSFAFSVPPELEPYQIPPLTLQPFVENSIIHGFRNGTQILDIHITGSLKCEAVGDELMLTVSDNGIGFAEEVLDMLRSHEGTSLAEDDHVGIWNVVRRLKLYVGEAASVSFSNTVPHGATVTLCLPAKQGEFQLRKEELR